MRPGARGLALAVAVAALGTTVGHAGNMAFKLDVELPCDSSGPYVVSLPLLEGVQDGADSGAALDPCDGLAGDGVVDTLDLACQLFSDRGQATAAGTGMTVQVFDPMSCSWAGVTLFWNGSAVQFIGSPVPVAPIAGAGGAFVVTSACALGETGDIVNPAALVGAHDVTFLGRPLGVSATGCVEDWVSVPYHTQYQRASEILCGLEGVDWVDADGDGLPDTCPGGVFDAGSGTAITVQTHDKSSGNWIGWTAFGVGGALSFIGTDFRLRQGEGYRVNWASSHPGSVFLSPHY